MPCGRPQRRRSAPDPARESAGGIDNAPRMEDIQPEAPLPAKDAQPIQVVQLHKEEIDCVTEKVLKHIRSTM